MTALPIWTVYDHPTDYPAGFIARLFLNDKPTSQVLTARSLDGVREQLPPGLYCIPRSPDDDPVIVECWL